MLDNLRRTLSAPAAVLALGIGWLMPPYAAVLWTAFLLTTIALPMLLPALAAIAPRRRDIVARSHWRALARDFALAAMQIACVITFLAHQAWLMTDAIMRTLFRLTLSRRNLLEWVTAAQSQGSTRPDNLAVYRHMSASVAIAIIAAGAAAWFGRGAWWLATPFALLWLAAPAVARYVSSSPLVAGRLPVTATDALALRLVARRTWRYFETFVTADDHMLPPDNFQEDPQPVVAHRTSPTNIGLYLLCTISARDYGWLGTVDVVERLEATFRTMQQLQRFHGHFFNWYDTSDLRPLEPRYVSSVDSGNLAAHLIALANACREWITAPAATAASVTGVDDALQLMRNHLLELPANSRTQVISRRQLMDAVDALSVAVANSTTVGAAAMPGLAVRSRALTDAAHALIGEQIGDPDHAGDGVVYWADAAHRCIESWHRDVTLTDARRLDLSSQLRALENMARDMAMSMQFDFLWNTERRLLSIGYRADDGVLDPSCYDLLASEARLASFFAIAKNDVPARHWFRLGRAATPIERGAALISWSGSMFEYLMPSLVLRAPAGSLLEQTSRLVVRRQFSYGAARGVPWGVSESAYSARDLEFTYQYSNFGIPGLGFKRGLSENLVIAPYATGLAAMVDPGAAVQNFAQLGNSGALGRHGYFEALDYTRSRLPAGAQVVMVRAYMAHHQGMTIVAIANVLFDGLMRTRFHSEPAIVATELLLQERIPRDVSIARPRAEEVNTAARASGAQQPEVRHLHTPHSATPQTHLLANGRYAVMLTAAGSGYSRWRDQAVTRWREDVTRDDSGSFIFLRDVANGKVWSAGYQPSGAEADSYVASFTEDRAELVRSDGTLTTLLQVVVSPEDDAEVRHLSITNSGNEYRDIDVTSYCELVLAPHAADLAHPAFSKLFVHTEYLPRLEALLATRRRRSAGEPEIWATHHAVVEAEVLGMAQFDTDRARFLGRSCEVNEPAAIMDGRPLSNTVGTVLDPIFALRYRLRVQPGATVRVSFWTEVASSRGAVLDLLDKHHDVNAYVRAATLAWTQAQVQLRHLGVTTEEAHFFQTLAGHVLYANAALRSSASVIRRGSGTPVALWAQSISGDLPIVLLRIDDINDISIVRQLLRAHEYWRMKQLAVDVVILNERASSYVQDLQIALETLLRTSQSLSPIRDHGQRGSVFVLRADLIATETRAILSAVARVVFIGQRGSLEEQLDRRAELPDIPPAIYNSRARAEPAAAAAAPPIDLEFYNGMGGFGAGGREYVTCLSAGQSTPAPWINVIANRGFGCQIAVDGGGYTWSINSRENQLTPWSNDPVSDRPAEVLYVRDDESGELWSPTAAPIRDDTAPYCARHGQGYSRFSHSAHAIDLELLVFVPLSDSIKVCRLTLHNASQRRRRLSVTAYLEWVLGTHRATSAPYIVTEIDSPTGAMFARNPWNSVFGTRVAFADLSGRQVQWTADRREFLGRHGRLDSPAALAGGAPLSGRTGPALDPCCALQAPLTLEPGASGEIVFLMGEAATAGEAQTLIERYRVADLDAALRAVTDYWDEVLGVIQVKTPDRSMDIMLNSWLLYQTLACRMWARSAFYQASGAYGFRDQLQDSMALAIAQPATARAHLLTAASRQFPEGDVQHWWLPPEGRGVRTRISDDRIWLAYSAAHYLAVTGDQRLLDEAVAFIEGAKLQAGDHDAYFQPGVADDNATFFEHCARGLDASLALGAHGLPLIGTGDWNDGLNRVGEQGRGESVWLGWFLAATLQSFAPVAQARGERERAERWLAHAEALREVLEREAWDGGWYRRGYFDDGTAFGSSASDECRIDSIAQSWSVISALGDPARAAIAMTAVDTQLIQRASALALLFAPPFDRSALEPGYIKAYPPGIRENGGQYTHAAAWSVIAFARLGQGDKAVELFSLLNPINRSSTRTGLRRYKVEPYVMAADVYSSAQHVGRGGWTWYTGAAGWMYQAGLEAILGFRKRGEYLAMAPSIPAAWPRFELTFRFKTSRYDILVENPDGVCSGVTHMALDDTALPDGTTRIRLVDDGATHALHIALGHIHADPAIARVAARQPEDRFAAHLKIL
jgi:cyclic beta-1,2-glucan synthetase